MPGCWGWLGSLGLEPKRLREVDDWRGVVMVDILVVEKAVAEEAVSRRVAMLAVFMVVWFLRTLLFEVVDWIIIVIVKEVSSFLCHLEGDNL